MHIEFTKRFQKDADGLSDEQREQLCSTILKLPTALKTPHLHSGIGLRKLHTSGIFEARLGLGLRLVFALKPQTIILHRVGNHDDIQRYLKNI